MSARWRFQLVLAGFLLVVVLLATWGETYVLIKKAFPKQASWVVADENQGSVCIDLIRIGNRKAFFL